jgi:L-ascorbate metabolism protein UlaG (beta-lactamase superfamily)
VIARRAGPLAFIAAALGAVAVMLARDAPAPVAGALTLRFLGHACFEITTSRGTRILTDPFPERLGIGRPDCAPHLVTVSHAHWDHAEVAPYAATVLQGLSIDVPARRVEVATIAGTFGDTSVRTFAARHDPPGRDDLGLNAIFRIEADGIAIVHLGDLGREPDAATLAALAPVDVLLVPVGGTFTLDAQGADALVKRLAPRIAIPMHHALPGLTVKLDPLERFLALRPDAVHAKGPLTLRARELPAPTRVVALAR